MMNNLPPDATCFPITGRTAAVFIYRDSKRRLCADAYVSDGEEFARVWHERFCCRTHRAAAVQNFIAALTPATLN